MEATLLLLQKVIALGFMFMPLFLFLLVSGVFLFHNFVGSPKRITYPPRGL